MSSLAIINILLGAEVSFHGQASSWLSAGYDSSIVGQAGLRYIPSLSFSLPFRLDAEASVNGYASALSRNLDSVEFEPAVKPYRLWLRYSTERFEARAGLQKINFGSAALLRPLQWFDRIDPRDPQQLTDGVYGLLARYYFQNNTNIWAWGLIGNSSPKGWEVYGSECWAPEPGARVQVPVPNGEVAATYDHRRFSDIPLPGIPVDEDRVGLDGKWDVGVGLWFEAALLRQNLSAPGGSATWQRAAALGMDYTVGVGSGLLLTVEHMVAGLASEPLGRSYTSDAQLSALMASYPLGPLDNLRAIGYVDWASRDLYSYAGWQRTFDKWMFSVIAFWNPGRPVAAFGLQVAGVAGKGVRVDVVYNH